ncbi:MAG: mechanosensitive ion channel, partial [Desulfobacteraceae bacterium]
ALGGIEKVSEDPPPQVGIQKFGDSSIDIGLRYWVPSKRYFLTLYEVNLAVYKALKEGGVEIPFPQRDVHIVSQSAEVLA